MAYRLSAAQLAMLPSGQPAVIPTWSEYNMIAGLPNGSGPTTFAAPTYSRPISRTAVPTVIPVGRTTSNIDWGDVGGTIVGIGLDWLGRRINPSVPTGTTPGPVTSQPLVPSQNCPEGTYGIPPACFNPPGGPTTGGGMFIGYGEAVMGRYGAAMSPAVIPQQVHRCPRGAVLGNDGLCYNRRDLRNSERKWPAPRKPLLTGGQLNAIAIAKRASNKLQGKVKDLQKMGMMPKPAPRRGRGPRHMPTAGSPVPGVQLISND